MSLKYDIMIAKKDSSELGHKRGQWQAHTIRRKDQLNEKETIHGPDENALIKTHIVCALYGIR